jgi:hypothetical protein
MAGSLIKIDEQIVTSAVSSVTLSGIDSTYDVYMLQVNNCDFSVGASLSLRVVKASDSSVDSTANYDSAFKGIRTISSFSNISSTNQTSYANLIWSQSATNTDTGQGIFYLFNFYNSSEYSFVTSESVAYGFPNGANTETLGNAGGGVHTVAQSNSGVNLFGTSGNIEAGTFTLYGLKK